MHVSATAFAADGLDVRGIHLKPAAAPLEQLEPTAATHLEVPWELDGNARWSLGVLGGFASQGYSLGGGGVSASLPSVYGTMFGLNASYLAANRLWQAELRVLHSSAQFFGLPAPVAPSHIDFSRTRLESVAYWAPFRGRSESWVEDLAFGLGLAYQQTDATLTGPVPLFVPQSQLGLLLAAKHRAFLVGDLALESNASIFLPFLFQENQATSGARVAGTAIDLGASFAYRFARSSEVLFGLALRAEHQWFRGSGTRGTVDASESYTTWRFPLELRTIF